MIMLANPSSSPSSASGSSASPSSISSAVQFSNGICPICNSQLGADNRKYEIRKYQFHVYECPECKLQMKKAAHAGGDAYHSSEDPYRYYDAQYFASSKSSDLVPHPTPWDAGHTPWIAGHTPWDAGHTPWDAGEPAPVKFSYVDEREDLPANRVVWLARLQTIAQYLAPPAKMLDVGCSFGGFTMEAQKFGYDARGIDVSAYAIREGVRAGANVSLSTLESYAFGSYDIITMIEVLEHVADPQRAFATLSRLLKKEGILVIQTANFSGWQARWAGADYHYYLPGHFYYYCKENLQRAFAPHGLFLERCYRPVDFSLAVKLKKMRLHAKNRNLCVKDRVWRSAKASLYHVASLLAIGNFSLTSSMVLYFRKK